MFDRIVRALRTPSSERYLLQVHAGQDSGALDLHYLPNGNITGTLTVFDQAGIQPDQVPEVLRYLDETLLPDVSLDDKHLHFTVVIGQVVGDFAQDKAAAGK